jgi:hypothetical protein
LNRRIIDWYFAGFTHVPAFKSAALCIIRQVNVLFKAKARHSGAFFEQKTANIA